MGDPQFQEFIKAFETLPQYIPAPLQCYRLIPDIDLNESVEKENEEMPYENFHQKDNITERRRRKLPETPPNKKPLEGLWQVVSCSNGIPLSEELSNPNVKRDIETKKCLVRQVSTNLFLEIQTGGIDGRPISLKLFSKDPTASVLSPEEDTVYKFGSDSGASSAHSPTATDVLTNLDSLPTDSALENGKLLQLRDATHRGIYKFIPRHADELGFDIGDPLYVSKENDDLWCEGINLRTGSTGVFPSAYATDVEYSDFVCEPMADDALSSINIPIKKERYLLDFLGSIEVMHHKGNPILCESVRRVIAAKSADIGMITPHPCILEISDLGVRIMDRKRAAPSGKEKEPSHDYFFALKHVTFCGYHPDDHHYFGFITKHPIEHRFACHVFIGSDSTRDVAEAVGRAFHRFYNRFIEMAYPIEEFYFE